MWWMFACTPPVEPAPTEVLSWKEESALVVAGLDEVRSLWTADQREAARVLAERVYTERWEPQLEVAVRKMEGPERALVLEYRFGTLMFVLKGNPTPAALAQHIAELQQIVREEGDKAARAFPPPGVAAAAPVDPDAPPSRPVEPKLLPAWEDAEGEAGGRETEP